MTVQDVVRKHLPDLTASQRKLATALLADYPFAGLLPIQQLANANGVSPPSISRFVQRLGFAGFAEFQQALIEDLREGNRSPRDLRAIVDDAPSDCFLAGYADRFGTLARTLPATVPQSQLDNLAALLGDPSREVYLRGGRISDSLARFLSLHLRQIRSGIHHLDNDPEMWPDALLRMRRKDVAVLFDFRRYQPSLERLAATIQQHRRAHLVLITDKWQSPAARYCGLVLTLPIEIGTAWDTVAAATALIEALIVTVSEQDWPRTEERIAALDTLRRALEDTDLNKTEIS